MEESVDSVRCVLRRPLKYASRDGEMNEAQFVEINAPTGKHSRQVAQLRQAIIRAIVQENEKKDVPEETLPENVDAKPIVEDDNAGDPIVEGLDVINILARSSGDLGDTYRVARELFVLKGIMSIDGEVNMTQSLLDKMASIDFEMLVGTYIANFTLPS